MTQCNLFFPLNASNPFSLLSTPFPASSLYLTSFAFPLTSTNTNTNASLFPGNLTNTNQSLLSLPGDLAITATGLGASGTLEIVGSDSSDMVANGTEGTVVVDVVVRYSGPQELNDMMKVCRMVKGGPDAGVGIYVSLQTNKQWMGTPNDGVTRHPKRRMAK